MSAVCPASFEDISDFRPVPDTQEVFADARSDQSLIFDILEARPDDEVVVGGEETSLTATTTTTTTTTTPAQFYFTNLALENEADDGSEEILFQRRVHAAEEMPTLLSSMPMVRGGYGGNDEQETVEAYLLVGRQRVAKFRDANTGGESARNTVEVRLLLIRLRSVATDLVVTMNSPLALGENSSSVATTTQLGGVNAEAAMARVLSSLSVHAWSLFGGGGDDESL
jgi:hypothetical protein